MSGAFESTVRRLGSGAFLIGADFIIQRLGLKTSAIAARTSRVGAVPAEEHPHVHFVDLRLGPSEKSAHAVPTIVIRIVVTVTFSTFPRGDDGFLPFDNELLIGLRQFLEWNVDVDLFPSAGAQQIFLRLAKFLAAKNPDGILLDGQRAIGNRFI